MRRDENISEMMVFMTAVWQNIGEKGIELQEA
jgi:hypothetical protein